MRWLVRAVLLSFVFSLRIEMMKAAEPSRSHGQENTTPGYIEIGGFSKDDSLADNSPTTENGQVSAGKTGIQIEGVHERVSVVSTSESQVDTTGYDTHHHPSSIVDTTEYSTQRKFARQHKENRDNRIIHIPGLEHVLQHSLRLDQLLQDHSQHHQQHQHHDNHPHHGHNLHQIAPTNPLLIFTSQDLTQASLSHSEPGTSHLITPIIESAPEGIETKLTVIESSGQFSSVAPLPVVNDFVGKIEPETSTQAVSLSAQTSTVATNLMVDTSKRISDAELNQLTSGNSTTVGVDLSSTTHISTPELITSILSSMPILHGETHSEVVSVPSIHITPVVDSTPDLDDTTQTPRISHSTPSTFQRMNLSSVTPAPTSEPINPTENFPAELSQRKSDVDLSDVDTPATTLASATSTITTNNILGVTVAPSTAQSVFPKTTPLRGGSVQKLRRRAGPGNVHLPIPHWGFSKILLQRISQQFSLDHLLFKKHRAPSNHRRILHTKKVKLLFSYCRTTVRRCLSGKH